MSFRDAQHAWSHDLDLFGRGSLFQRVDWCRTLPGRRLLATWMTTVPDPETVTKRQHLADALSTHLSLRENLATIDGGLNWETAEKLCLRPGYASQLNEYRPGY